MLCKQLDLDVDRVFAETTTEREQASSQWTALRKDPDLRTSVISLITDLLIKIDTLNKDQLVVIKSQLNLLNQYIDLIKAQLDLLSRGNHVLLREDQHAEPHFRIHQTKGDRIA